MNTLLPHRNNTIISIKYKFLNEKVKKMMFLSIFCIRNSNNFVISDFILIKAILMALQVIYETLKVTLTFFYNISRIRLLYTIFKVTLLFVNKTFGKVIFQNFTFLKSQYLRFT